MAWALLALYVFVATPVQVWHHHDGCAKTPQQSQSDKAKANLDPAVLKILAEKFNQLENFTPESIESACKEVANDIQGGKLGKVAMPLRAALTGTTVSPSVFHAAVILGKDETLARLNNILTA